MNERPGPDSTTELLAHEAIEALRRGDFYEDHDRAVEYLTALRTQMQELEQERKQLMGSIGRLSAEGTIARAKLAKAEQERDSARAHGKASIEGLTRRIIRVEQERDEARAKLEAAEDFRAEIVVEAFTGPEADWNTILDSLRARIAGLSEEAPEFESHHLSSRDTET